MKTSCKVNTKATPLDRKQRAVITVIYKSLPKYRIPFFNALKPFLAKKGISFRLIYGQPSSEEAMKGDTGHIDWALAIRNQVFNFGSRSLYWQPCLSLIKGNDLVVVEQASKLLINYLLLAAQLAGGPKVAFWGHGRNFMVHKASFIGEAVKRHVSRHAHWWFAYNERSATVVRNLGFPAERISVVQNAIDTKSMQEKSKTIQLTDLKGLRNQLGLKSDNIAIYSGGLYAEKRIDFLIESVRSARKIIGDFELIILGAGSEANRIKEAVRKDPWIHYAGSVFDEAKVPYFMLSKVSLLPGLVGLGVIDSFAFEVPLVTIDLPGHGPEIEYLHHGENALLLRKGTSPEEFARVVTKLMLDEGLRGKLKSGCQKAAAQYTLEGMVERFAEGVLKALNC